MQRKKSRFWLFIWSLVPGAGEMYLGFMKMGLSLMLGFFILCAVVGLTNIAALSIFPTVMYIYSFFHANNLGSLNDAQFYAIKDQYLFGMEGLDSLETMQGNTPQKYRKITAAVMIVIGVIMLWNLGFDLLVDIFGWDNVYLEEIRFFVRNRIPRAVIAVVIIWIGISLIRGKKADHVEEEQNVIGRQDTREDGQDNTAGQNIQDSQNNE